MSATRKQELLALAVAPGSVVAMGPYTRPKTYGVYRLNSQTKSGRTYRYGNHPVRMAELVRDYGKAELVALFRDRPLAVELAAIENALRNG